MRTLVILRGAPAAGKSTWIKNMGLEGYTLCADDIRLLIQSPIMTADSTHFQISQQNDKRVWSLLFELLEERMAKGEFVVVDATHCKSTDFSRYNKLCERYRYRRYWVDFSDVPIDICKERNANRDAYKRVPEHVIDKMYARMETQGNTSGWVKVDKDNFWDSIAIKPLNYNLYENIVVFGDIHGCYQPLKEYFNERPFNDDTMYIFTGDYIDRGIQNKEVLEFLFSIMGKRNVLFLEGNHERWLYYYSHDEIEEVKSKEFKNNTIPQIYDVSTKEIRQFYRKLGQMAYFTFNDKTYFISHGGISYMPDNLQLVATEQFLKGVGSYKTNIDEIWSNNENEIIQIHGHRNVFDVNSTNTSHNLEDKIEFGGNLNIYIINKDKNNEFLTISNTIYRKLGDYEYSTTKKLNDAIHDVIPLIDQLRAEKDIKEKELGNNISSFNFTRNAFYNKNWNDLICKARGLFVDTTTNKVVARGYEKFFNINEVKATDITHLVHKFGNNKITCYKKENGFLGIMSWVNGELFMATKSSNQGDHVGYFKQIYEQSDINKEELETFLKNNNVSLLFEVVDIENDPHIIKYDKSDIILLDIVDNDYEFKRWAYNLTKSIANSINCKCKTIAYEFNNSKEFYEWYLAKSDEDNMEDVDIEGVVIECNNFMTKLKFPYYKFWKMMRGVKDKVAHGSNIRLASLYNAESNYFYAWLKTLDKEVVQNADIITLRDMFYKANIIKNTK